jgi:hypothetical protein
VIKIGTEKSRKGSAYDTCLRRRPGPGSKLPDQEPTQRPFPQADYSHKEKQIRHGDRWPTQAAVDKWKQQQGSDAVPAQRAPAQREKNKRLDPAQAIHRPSPKPATVDREIGKNRSRSGNRSAQIRFNKKQFFSLQLNKFYNRITEVTALPSSFDWN